VSQKEEPESDLNQLQARIRQMQKEETTAQAPQASVHLVFSLGFTVVASLMVSDYFGRWLSEKAGNPQYRMVGWVLGLGMAAIAVYKQLRPFLK